MFAQQQQQQQLFGATARVDEDARQPESPFDMLRVPAPRPEAVVETPLHEGAADPSASATSLDPYRILGGTMRGFSRRVILQR